MSSPHGNRNDLFKNINHSHYFFIKNNPWLLITLIIKSKLCTIPSKNVYSDLCSLFQKSLLWPHYLNRYEVPIHHALSLLPLFWFLLFIIHVFVYLFIICLAIRIEAPQFTGTFSFQHLEELTYSTLSVNIYWINKRTLESLRTIHKPESNTDSSIFIMYKWF